MLARFNVDLVQRFDVFGDERDRDDQQMLLPFPRQDFERLRQRGFEPLLPADPALEAKQVRVRPSAASHHGGDSFLDLALVWIAALDEAERQAVRAENEVHFAAIIETRERRFDIAHECLDILRMHVKFFDEYLARRGSPAAVRRRLRGADAAPFFQAAERGGEGVVRIKRQQNESVEWRRRPYRVDSFLCERMPVAHGDEAAGVEIGRERGFESARLKFGEPTDRRLAADSVVMFANDSGAAVGDPPGERTARQPSTEEIDDVGIAEKIVEE